jgi:hypothetical protein
MGDLEEDLENLAPIQLQSREGFCEVKAAAHRVFQEGDVEGREGWHGDFGEGH